MPNTETVLERLKRLMAERDAAEEEVAIHPAKRLEAEIARNALMDATYRAASALIHAADVMSRQKDIMTMDEACIWEMECDAALVPLMRKD